jgi:hypothetical protein
MGSKSHLRSIMKAFNFLRVVGRSVKNFDRRPFLLLGCSIYSMAASPNVGQSVKIPPPLFNVAGRSASTWIFSSLFIRASADLLNRVGLYREEQASGGRRTAQCNHRVRRSFRVADEDALRRLRRCPARRSWSRRGAVRAVTRIVVCRWTWARSYLKDMTGFGTWLSSGPCLFRHSQWTSNGW